MKKFDKDIVIEVLNTFLTLSKEETECYEGEICHFVDDLICDCDEDDPIKTLQNNYMLYKLCCKLVEVVYYWNFIK